MKTMQTPRGKSKGAAAAAGNLRRQLSGRSKRENRSEIGEEDDDIIQDFDLGTFYNFAEWYKDENYMSLALSLFDKAPPGTVLRTPSMSGIVSRRMKQEARDGATDSADGTQLDPVASAKQVVFTLPTSNKGGGFTWDKVAYKLPTFKDKASRESRAHLLNYLDRSNDGRISIEELKLGLARVINMPGQESPESMLDEVVLLSQRAVQGLMLDGAPRLSDDVITKEFRVFLTFLQGYIDLWEIFYEVECAEEGMFMLQEFTQCVSRLRAWGVDDPALVQNPTHVYSQIDRDGSGYITFPDFADFCVRKGLMDEIVQDLR